MSEQQPHNHVTRGGSYRRATQSVPANPLTDMLNGDTP